VDEAHNCAVADVHAVKEDGDLDHLDLARATGVDVVDVERGVIIRGLF
jgi:hypothetical protein